MATVVTIDAGQWKINGALTYPNAPAEGLLLNSRMIQAAFDDDNGSTVGNWESPDTETWDPDRNVTEFIAARRRTTPTDCARSRSGCKGAGLGPS